MPKFKLAFLAFFVALTPLWASGYTPIEDSCTVSVLTPPLQERQTAKIRLDNGLEAYIISDPGANNSAAALAVETGSWSDPEDAPGLAHFCEHMLFLGTKQYPEEGGYHRFVGENGGMTNAYTASDHTAFMFTVNHAGFVESLDRFSCFFKDPLFNTSGLERERQAVDQEFHMHLNSDSRRGYHVLKELSNPAHPMSRFATGNIKTLEDVTTEKIRSWYNEHYSANLMHLVVYSPLPIEELTSLVVQDFGGIATSNKVADDFKTPLLSNDSLGKMVYIAPLKDTRELSLTWELPAAFARQLQTRPDQLISFVLGHEGEESLLAQLKRENLAEGLSSGGWDMSPHSLLFTVNVQLTEQGLQQMETVIERLFQGIAMIERKGVPRHIFDEENRMATLGYQYQSRENAFETVSAHVRAMLFEPLSSYPQESTIIERYDPALITKFIEQLRPNRCLYTITASPAETKVPLDTTEKWLGVSYSVRGISSGKLKGWTATEKHTSIALPTRNLFVPTELTLKESPSTESDGIIIKPEAIIDDAALGQLFFAQDTRYQVPEIDWMLKIKTPSIDNGNAAATVLADLYVKSIAEILNPTLYKASLAGLQFGITTDHDGIVISLKGYSENAPKLLQSILEQMKTSRPTEEKFVLYRKALRRSYENFRKEPPLQQGMELLRSVIYRDFVTAREKAQAIKMIAYKDLLDFSDNLFTKCYLEGVVYGNMTKADAENLWQQYRTTLHAKGFSRDKQKEREVVVFGKGGPFYLERTTNQAGNAVILAVQNGPYSFHQRAAQQILGTTMEEPFFSELRTKQQTGYIVYNTTQDIERQLFTFFGVQSSSHNNRDLLARFEQFIEGYLQELENSEKAHQSFDNVKASLITTLKQPPKNMNDMVAILNLLAFEYKADFDFINKRIDAIEELSFEEYTSLAQEFLGRNNKGRLAILVKGVIPDEVGFDYRKMKSASALRSKSEYVGRVETVKEKSTR